MEEPDVEAGVSEIENIFNYGFGPDDEFDNEVELSHGFNDWFALKASILSHDEQNEHGDWVSGLEIATQFHLAKEGQYIPESAIQLAYTFDTTGDHPDEVEVKGFFSKHIGKFDNLLNISFANEVGDNAEGGVEFSLGARSAYEFSEHFAIGAEYFGEFGQIDDMQSFEDEGHQLGPVVMFEPIEHLHTSVAYLFGLSDKAPDGTLKLEVGYEF